jgi:DNA-binding response OmpR family regulator
MNILVAEDEAKVASFIKQGLEENGYDVAIVYEGGFAKRFALEQEFDLIILDVMLPQINGFELCKTIREAKPHVPILMLTALGTTEDKVQGLDSGADDYLVKPFQFEELLARIRALTRRGATPQSQTHKTLKFANLELDLDLKEAKRDGHTIKLTAKEFALLEMFMCNVGKVLSRTEIAAKVWNIHFDTGTNMVDVYVNHLRSKIDKNFTQKLLHTHIGMGYVMREEG